MSDTFGPPRVEVEGEPDDPLTRQITSIVRYEINARSVYSVRMYFNSDPEDDRFVTVAYLASVIRQQRSDAADQRLQWENRIIALHQRINVLEQPWWKRWWRR
jgi:hypothetical protein